MSLYTEPLIINSTLNWSCINLDSKDKALWKYTFKKKNHLIFVVVVEKFQNEDYQNMDGMLWLHTLEVPVNRTTQPCQALRHIAND